MIKMFKEPFNGSYNGITPPTLLPVGAISDGLNVRKIGEGGGWKPRKGCTLHNTSAVAGCSSGSAGFLSLHQYTHPRNNDYHFLAQHGCLTEEGNLYDATNDPPASGAAFGTAIKGNLSLTVPGFSTMVGETFCYADGSGRPTVWEGDNPFCSGFIAHFDLPDTGTPNIYVDYTREVTDNRTGTYATLRDDAHDVYYACSPEIAEAITLDLEAVNAQTITLKVQGWQGGAWVDLGDSVRSATYKWTQSVTQAGEYYLEAAAGGDPGISEPQSVTEGGTLIVKDTLGSLAASSWGWGDNDAAIDFDTLYVRQDNDADPDGEDAGHIKIYFDATTAAGKTHAVDGAITWTRNTSDTMRVIGGIMGYWYKVVFSGALTAGVQILSCKVKYDASLMSNKWNGVYEYPTGVRFFDASAGEYIDNTGKVLNESTSQYMQIGAMVTDVDLIYTKSAEPLTGIGFAVVPDYTQAEASKVDKLEVWTGIAWTDASAGIIDETLDDTLAKSFAQTGTIWFNAAAVTAKRRTFDWDSIPGYWYRMSISATLTDTDVRIFSMASAMFPDPLGPVKGVIEFKDRLFTWGDPEFPNRLRYSANGRPDCFSGSDSGYTDAFGDMTPITCALRFYNELIVWKKNSVWLLEGYSPQTFGTLRIADTVGLASPKSAVVVETGYPAMKTDEPLSIAVWQDTDGVYVLDGRKPKKVSGPVDHYFNTEHTTAIHEDYINNRQSFVDPLNNEYHLLLPTSELVYNYIRAEWYPPWERNVDLVCGLSLRGDDNRYYTYGADAGSQVYKLETDTTDKTAANVDVAISHKVKTRAISVKPPEATTLRFSFRKLWVEGKAQDDPTAITTTFFKNMIDTGVALATPAAIDMEVDDHGLAFDGLDTSQEGCVCFELEFSLDSADLEMELWSFLYQLEARGEIVL